MLDFDRNNNDSPANILVVGVGGGGGNAVDRMIEDRLDGVEFVTVNTDIHVLARSKAPMKLQVGEKKTRGLGAGGEPPVGKSSAEESLEEIIKIIKGCDLLFITAGMGGGTGTGAAPVIAKAARELGILTVGVVTKPFEFEGRKRMKYAEEGIEELKQFVDILVIVPNEKLLTIIDKKTTQREAFRKVDEVLRDGVRGIANVISKAGDVNVDFADVRTIMSYRGVAHMGIGHAKGENKVEEAAKLAINSPLLDTTIEGARGLLINYECDPKIGLSEIAAVSKQIEATLDSDATVMWGSYIDDALEDEVVVTIIATGLGKPDISFESSLINNKKPAGQPESIAAPSQHVTQPHVVRGTSDDDARAAVDNSRTAQNESRLKKVTLGDIDEPPIHIPKFLQRDRK